MYSLILTLGKLGEHLSSSAVCRGFPTLHLCSPNFPHVNVAIKHEL